MIIFFDDRPVRIVRTNQLSAAETSRFEHIVDLRLEKLQRSMLTGHVLFLNSTTTSAIQVIQMLEKEFPKDMLSITMATREKSEVEDKIKAQYKVIKAAGGVVVKDGKWLFMYRRKMWDLPKGKLDKGENSKVAAIREIEEETGVKALIRDKICTTWHTYTLNNSRILKRTKWYLLDCLDDSQMSPQAEEQIEKLDWYEPSDVKPLLIQSYSSIRYVVDSLNKIHNLKES
ncbi:ADP-ribose pyrophosphatase YjhB (NUDIX family) [Dyadobacter sp. BE34]|uniref:ADP-ribose pyrophosphatase YjhB (NUDIX family) n=1 Tax=Dyadobacter fermentans TaxID=94254 RepID=A0ABU1QYH1_9BACT|nr:MULTISPECIES: NUDIX domain-containing protein [Dyadobacter]HWV29916.1 NUDIX domain-containing protein [Dyadobacter sp.]MDR6806209.1 ADP-ribose pyrophosphatase YjhB (NUDIX family) [Dyadobacter fermentans]MDR7043950.1 ADP-ribose pyrophosphatase YjhB (NUDIX family) [Dyadobacter sp. BE242]MDR7198261.1 ADP-ribose pyrophosphatase YjhB (NUDIX family) [Dyadobacter sp. BE34]MDR7216224.1 ADP-ribose pyrophosphatase YjhB (NUDIX family) [Dyadobacter sp. BE31]